MVERYRQKKLLIHPPDLSYQQSSSSRQDKWVKEIMNLVLQSIFVHTSQAIFTCHKILQHGTSGFTSPPNEGVLQTFITLKIHHLGSD
jgi:hypothetical protein